MEQKVLITAALLYGNGALHFGHIAGSYLPADCYARFERLLGKEVLFICGSDEYGVAITLSAELAGRSYKDHVDHYHALNQRLFKQLHISFDHYSRTTWEGHRPLVEEFFLDLYKNGHIEARTTPQLYSEQEHRFLADRYVIGTCPRCGYEQARGDECSRCGASYEAANLLHPRSKLTNAPLVKKETTHWYLLFDKFKQPLADFLASKPWKANVINFTRHYIQELHPRSITRDLDWGIPVPLKEAKDKVFYVWFDAPIGYLSATADWAVKKGAPHEWKEWWCDPKTKYVQFMGKDNIPFHALFFPAMIMGQNQPYKFVDELVANEFYNLEGKKLSKSDGWVVDLEDFLTRYSADQLRYAIAASAPETADSEFTWKEFQMRCNVELLGKFGNLVNRTLVFLQNNYHGKIPPRHPLEEADTAFLSERDRLLGEIKDSYASFRIKRASQLLMEMVQAGNSYFDVKAPWLGIKDKRLTPSMETTLTLCLESLKLLALTSYPILPETAQKIWKMLGFTGSLADHTWQEIVQLPLTSHTPLPPPEILFKKIEDEAIEQEIVKLKQSQGGSPMEKSTLSLSPLKALVDIEEFKKLDLRVGLILKAEKVPKSKKLLHLEVDIGIEKRTIVSGISHVYSPEQLIGKKVVVVANLKPATLMGIESKGMILAGHLDSQLELLLLQDLPVGAEIT